MIPQHELRIGNWVLFDDKSNDAFYPCRIYYGDSELPLEDIQGVLLNESILSQCGFTNSGLYWYEHNSTIHWDFCLYDFRNVPKSANTGKWAPVLLHYECEVNTFLYPIQYLHQLQNVFYHTTGREILINLK